MSLNAYQTIPGFLGPDINSQLLDHCVTRESEFQQSTVGKTSRHDPSVRVSSILKDVGPFKALIERRLLTIVPDLITELGVTPFTPAGLEMEVAAHGDGAFFQRHIDLFTGEERSKRFERLISVVYYFHKELKSFAGGSLRLYPQPGAAYRPDEPAIDITPEQDIAIAFSRCRTLV